MINTRFEAYKIKRELKRSGKEYTFKRNSLNEFGEPNEELEIIDTILGLYHEQNSYIQITNGETTRSRTEKIPMILCIYEDAKNLKTDDIVVINENLYKINGVTNIQEWGIVADISLEVFDNGNNS